jgi:hypothetical protein
MAGSRVQRMILCAPASSPPGGSGPQIGTSREEIEMLLVQCWIDSQQNTDDFSRFFSTSQLPSSTLPKRLLKGGHCQSRLLKGGHDAVRCTSNPHQGDQPKALDDSDGPDDQQNAEYDVSTRALIASCQG